jgi:hypothetical protein
MCWRKQLHAKPSNSPRSLKRITTDVSIVATIGFKTEWGDHLPACTPGSASGGKGLAFIACTLALEADRITVHPFLRSSELNAL